MDAPRTPLKNLILLPLGLLLNLTPLWAVTWLLILVSICGTLYYSLNSDFFGLAAPPFAELTFSKDYTAVRDQRDNRTWQITYENLPSTTFHGVVRHVSNWRDDPIPFATHDILVTTGEFTSSARVKTRVYNHAFFYTWGWGETPQGTINLLHIVPQTEQIYRQLLEIRDWNLVTITGREIYRIDLFDPAGEFTHYWQDDGCNSILVTSVTIEAPGTPIP